MLSTSISSTSDYYSGSELDYDDDVVRAAPQHHSTTHQTNTILQTLIQHHHQPLVSNSSTIRLLKVAKMNYLSDEIFIRANAILHKFLHLSSISDVDDSILIACLSLATKLSQHSSHSNIALFQSSSLLLNENLICDVMDWDIDIMTPIHYVEAILLHMNNSSMKDCIRNSSYELIVLCLTNVSCIDINVISMGRSCLLLACELLNCNEIVPKEVYEYDQDKNVIYETSLNNLRQILMDILSC